MIDTYFDRVDAACGYKPTRSAPLWEDPRYYKGSLYATLIDRNVAEAREKLHHEIRATCSQHLREQRLGIPAGHRHSLFTFQGHHK